MAGKVYTTDGKLLSESFPKIQIGDKLYSVDTRKKTYKKIQAEVAANSKLKPNDPKRRDDEVIMIEGMLGKEAFAELEELYSGEENFMDVRGYTNLAIYLQAILMDIPFEEAEKRFQNYIR